jgi:hypothetical protein
MMYLLGTMLDLKARVLEMEIIDVLDDPKEAKKFLKTGSGSEFQEKWRIVSGLVSMNTNCSKLKTLRRLFKDSEKEAD